jgi:hypothetical protein
MTDDDRYMTMPEVIAHIRRALGCDEQTATTRLLKALRSGELHSHIVDPQGRMHDIPPDFYSTPTTTGRVQ